MEPGKRFTTFCGSLHYACPEILRGEEYIGPGVDIWSIGVILYCLVVGRQPWDAENAEGLINAILEDGLEVPSGLSDACVDLLLQMLRVAESDRIPIAKIRTHPWILEGYDEPPPSYLPPSQSISEIDDSIIEDLVALNFISNDEDSIAAAKKELLSNQGTQLLVVYNLLLQQKQKKTKPPKDRELYRTKSESKKKLDIELPEKSSPTKEDTISMSSLATSMSVTTRKKTKKSIIVTTARNEATPQKTRNKKRVSKKGIPQSPMNSLIPPAGVEPPTPSHVSANRRQRSVSMSPNNNARPVMDFDNIKQNKITPSKHHKKRSQTPQKIRRPVLTEAVFKPPAESAEESHSPEMDRRHPDVEGHALALPETVSSKPLDKIVEEIVRVLNSQGLNHRKRKNKYIWKCSAQINSETVTLQLEIYKDMQTENFGIILRRIQGSFTGYQVLYNRIKTDLQL